jgi:hypothetical protein
MRDEAEIKLVLQMQEKSHFSTDLCFTYNKKLK